MTRLFADHRLAPSCGRVSGLPGRRLALVGLAVFVLMGSAACATSAALRSGRQAERTQDYDRAVVEYTRALQQDPDNQDARLALERAQLQAAQAHFEQGRRLASAGAYDEALLELQIAAELNPTSGAIDEALRDARVKVQIAGASRRDGQTELEALIERTRDLGPLGLELPPDVALPETLVFRDASARDVLSAIGQFTGLSVVFDPAYRDTTVSVDLRNTPLDVALASVTSTTRHFYRVTAPQTITIIPDTPAKRREYEEEIVRTFYVSHVDLAETIDLLRLVLDLRRLAPIPGTKAISVKDTRERIDAASKLLSAIDKARPEVVVEVELLEVDRQTLKEYGLQFATPGASGIDTQVDINRQDLTLDDLRNLSQSDVFVANLPSLFFRLLKRDADTRILASPRLRTAEGVAAQAQFGDEVPVPVTTFTPIAAGGVQQQPITSFNYRNIGVNIDITPRIHHNDDVTLALQIQVSSISGTGFGNLPTFGNRAINTTIRLRDGETNILAGLIRDEEREVLEGIPGLSDLPVIGRLFARNRRETQETDIIITLTPHIIRGLDLTETDLRPFRVQRDSGSPAIDIPLPIPPQPQVPLEPGQQRIAPTEPPPAVPIEPPPPVPMDGIP